MRKLMLVVFAALLCTSCTLEVRNGNEVWACEEQVNGSTFSGCQDTGVRVGW